MKLVEDIFPRGLLNNEAQNELYKIIKKEEEVNRDNLFYKRGVTR